MIIVKLCFFILYLIFLYYIVLILYNILDDYIVDKHKYNIKCYNNIFLSIILVILIILLSLLTTLIIGGYLL